MFEFSTLYLIPLLPLCGAALLGLFGRRLDKDLATLIALSSVLGSFLVTVVATYTIVTKGGALENHLWTWMEIGRYRVDLTFGLDQLSAALLLVVTGVGFLIHVYSAGYMHDDPGYTRYFAYLNLFIFAMSVLVIGRSLPVMFVGWEGVGLASYLLIGFWYSDEAKAKAGRKAFVVNRIGDFGFLIGMFSLLSLFGTLDFVELDRAIQGVGVRDQILTSGIFNGWQVGTVLNFAGVCLFLGACGKSAQLPLYVWLPDAMAGPTPVSALIHAATMVTSGVFMCSRMHTLFDLAPEAQHVVAWVGGLTAVFAATIGLAQNDIKKVLAYSTVSQLGYMFLAVGLGAYTAAMFHVITHAFFKACMFLGSGTVIHALHGEQDIRKMGGLKGPLASTFWPFFVSTLAIAGFPLTSGFFSKDLILGHAFHHDKALFVLGLCGAALTAFYMGRLVMLTFAGKSRAPDPHAHEHLHLPSGAMVFPVVTLGALAVVGGLLNLPHAVPGGGFLEHWFQAVLGEGQALHLELSTEAVLWAVSSAVGIGGLLVARAVYKDGPSAALERLSSAGAGRWAHQALLNKWYVDEIYEATVVRASRFLGSLAAMIFDPWIIDGILVKLLPGLAVKTSGAILKKPQNGNVQAYATLFVVAAAVITTWAVWK